MASRRLHRIVCGGFLVLCATLAAAAEIAPSAKLPPTMPWNLKQLSAPPAFDWVNKDDTVRSLLYEGEPFGGKPTHVFAYYATPGTLARDPSRDKKLPAVVLVHGGGGTAYRQWCELWAKRGYAAIAMDLAGYRPAEGKNPDAPASRTRLPDGGPDQGDEYKFGAIDKPVTEQWSYHAVANVLRAHSLIRSFPEIDADKTAVTGISWGGYLTCIVAGVDNRFKAAVPVYGCGFLYEDSAWLAKLDAMAPQQREKWITLWDPSKYLPSVSMPICFVNGTNDFAYPLDSYMNSYDAVPGAKQIRITVNMPHGHPPGWAPPEIGLFVDQQLLGGKALPIVGDPKIDGDKLRSQISKSTQIAVASLHFTSDIGPINKRDWQSKPATLEGKNVVAEKPPADATAWFVTVKDDRGAIVSSRVTLEASKISQSSPALRERLRTKALHGHPSYRPGPSVICFGDSVTGLYYHTGGRRAYSNMLGIALNRVYPSSPGALISVVNAGVSGNTTADALARIDTDVLKYKPDLVTVMFGLNDVARGAPDQYRANLKTIVDKCRAAGSDVLLCTPNDVITTSGRPAEKLEHFCKIVHEVGREKDVPVCDVYRGMEAIRRRDPMAWRMLMSDEIHPNLEGHTRIAELMAYSITGRDISLANEAPDSLVTLYDGRDNKAFKILAMPPFDKWIAPSIKKLLPSAQIEVITWDISGKSLRQLEQDAKERVRVFKPDLVVIAIPRSAQAESTEAFIHSYAWIMNWSLSFGQREWDCVVIHPSVADPEKTDKVHDDMVRQLVRAQGLTTIDRKADDKSSASELFDRWIATMLRRDRTLGIPD